MDGTRPLRAESIQPRRSAYLRKRAKKSRFLGEYSFFAASKDPGNAVCFRKQGRIHYGEGNGRYDSGTK